MRREAPVKVLFVANLRKVYGDTAAVDGISFEVGPQEIVGLLGPNGAGKTTTITFFEDVWARNFLNVFAAPLTIAEYLAGLVLSSIATSLVGLAVMHLLATTRFGLSYLSYGPSLVPILLVIFLFGIALGIFGIAVVLRLGPASEWFIWPIPALLSPFVGVFYPLSVLPEWIRGVSYVLPPAYVFESFRTIIPGGTLAETGILSGVGLSGLYILAACWFFARMYRHAVLTGLIAPYSAETMS